MGHILDTFSLSCNTLDALQIKNPAGGITYYLYGLSLAQLPACRIRVNVEQLS